MKKYETIQEGDIILVFGTKFLARSIQLFQRIYKKRKHIKEKLTPNHADRVRIFNDKLCVVGMVPNPAKKNLWSIFRTGLYTREFLKEYGNKKNYMVLTPRIPYTKKELEILEQYTNELEARSVRYGFMDIYYQMIYSITGKWKGKIGPDAEDRLICTEFIPDGENKIRSGSFLEPWRINPTEIQLSKLYKPKKIDYEYYKNLYIKYKEEHHEKIF